MRWRRLLALTLLLGPASLAAACQLVDPASDLDGAGGDGGALAHDAAPALDGTLPTDGGPADASPLGDGDASPAADGGALDAGSFCLGVDAAVCDGFDDDGLVTADPARNYDDPTCPNGSILVTDGQLVIDHPSNDGSHFSACAFNGDPPASVGSFTLDLDFTYKLDGSYTDAMAHQLAIIASVTLTPAKTTDAGIDDYAFQVLLDSVGQAQLIALPHYPDSSRSPQVGNSFPTFDLADIFAPGVWLPQGTACHLAIAVDVLATPVSGTAVATCAGTSVSMHLETDAPPPAFAAPAELQLGYVQPSGQGSWAEWSLTYDNVLFRTRPTGS